MISSYGGRTDAVVLYQRVGVLYPGYGVRYVHSQELGALHHLDCCVVVLCDSLG